ncbi:hypothetical protein D6D18_04564 [Aureobasidium pullulans]|nr:hypothetical protein D6D18_04564 [Aureobasidium pullulans]
MRSVGFVVIWGLFWLLIGLSSLFPGRNSRVGGDIFLWQPRLGFGMRVPKADHGRRKKPDVCLQSLRLFRQPQLSSSLLRQPPQLSTPVVVLIGINILPSDADFSLANDAFAHGCLRSTFGAASASISINGSSKHRGLQSSAWQLQARILPTDAAIFFHLQDLYLMPSHASANNARPLNSSSEKIRTA